eukprot:gnl/TRDRNA2_/TRDRNA2_49605_c0_seq1.p1 gnl/TRDRNA2_/TRDRNA2_49605_c0~~gnl/TRDRNA2_/TRDRNA2_49605_c0_seq1.p1  ORF type:complete len:255 (-),score=24.64 gnl/TRDRNA2_/TRDRNA2_49605_c0_seq1:228-896(-)
MAVARILKLQPFSRPPSLHDFRDCPIPSAPWDPPSPVYEYDDICESQGYERYMQEQAENDEMQYWQQYGIPWWLERVGLRRHVIDLGPQKLLSMSAAVVAYSGSLLRDTCTLRVQASVDGYKPQQSVEIAMSKPPGAGQSALVKLSTNQPIVGRMFSFIVLPSAYDSTKRPEIQLEGLELYGALINVPDSLVLDSRASFLFDAESSKFKKVDLYREEIEASE